MSNYSWTVPGSGGSVVGVSSQEQASQSDKLFGKDLYFDVSNENGADLKTTAKGDWLLVSGREALRQALIRRLITNPGEWQVMPDYGVGARLFVKARNTSAMRLELEERIRAQFLQDYRVLSVEQIIIERSENVLQISVEVNPKGKLVENEPLTASIKVS